MRRTQSVVVGAVLLALVAFASDAVAVPTFIGPGPGGVGYNAYRMDTTARTWDYARVNAKNTLFGYVRGHLITLHSAAETTFLGTVLPTDNYWNGLTDATQISTIDGFDPATSLGTAEFGNTSGLAYPPAGQTPGTTPGTQRGEGWAWVTGEPLTYQNWGANEPNNAGGEDASHIRGDWAWNDHNAGTTLGETDHNLRSIIEFEWNMPGPVPFPYSPGFRFREVKASGAFLGPSGNPGQVHTLADGEALLALNPGDAGHQSETIWMDDFVDHGSGAGPDHFVSDLPFENGAGDDFALEATGWLEIPAPGTWTFGTNSDDGTGLWIGPFSKIDDVLSGPHDDLATFTFATAGLYPIRLVFFERGGGDEVELYAAPGTWASWGATGTWRLVGDVANGGLRVLGNIPEPATLSLLGLGGLLAAHRRRRRAR